MKVGRTPRWLIGAATVGLALVLGACGGDGDSVTGATSPGTGSTSATSASSTTTTLAPPPAGTIPFIVIPPTSTDGTSPEGSGCTPSAGRLPDGIWFGEATDIDPATDTMDLDLACLYFFEAANVAAAADGFEEIPVPNDYWVRNQSSNLYELEVIPDVAVGVVTMEGSGGIDFEPTQSGLAAAASMTGGSAVWVEVVDGWVVAIQQQYFP